MLVLFRIFFVIKILPFVCFKIIFIVIIIIFNSTCSFMLVLFRIYFVIKILPSVCFKIIFILNFINVFPLNCNWLGWQCQRGGQQSQYNNQEL
eukprot:10822.XXX_545692_545967_1 [CDS] Oithona nana genome sequencing.